MKILAVVGLIFLSGPSLAEIMPQGDVDFKCQTTGGFFDFSPANAIASCKQEIDEFCKTKNAPPIVGKVIGVPSGFGVYAQAQISFQCGSKEDLVRRQEAIAEGQRQQIKQDVEGSKKTCQEDFGFTPATPEFGNCLLELQKQLFANRRAEKDLAAQNDIAEAMIAQQRKAASERAAANAFQSIQQITAPRPPLQTNQMTAPRTPVETNCTTTASGSQTTCITK